MRTHIPVSIRSVFSLALCPLPSPSLFPLRPFSLAVPFPFTTISIFPIPCSSSVSCIFLNPVMSSTGSRQKPQPVKTGLAEGVPENAQTAAERRVETRRRNVAAQEQADCDLVAQTGWQFLPAHIFPHLSLKILSFRWTSTPFQSKSPTRSS